MSMKELDTTLAQLKNMDFHLCKCGSLALNETMCSRQQCQSCKRLMCFFCNVDWDDKTMHNGKFTCKVNCTWKTRLTFQSIPWKGSTIPNRRCCPKCGLCGVFGNDCKYHTCECSYEFCFICLASKEECKRAHHRKQSMPMYERCAADEKIQNYRVFPRMMA